MRGAQRAPVGLRSGKQRQLSRKRGSACQAQSLGAAVRSWFSGVFAQSAPSKRGQVLGMRSSEGAASTIQRPPNEDPPDTDASASEGSDAVEEARGKLQEGELMATTHQSIDAV